MRVFWFDEGAVVAPSRAMFPRHCVLRIRPSKRRANTRWMQMDVQPAVNMHLKMVGVPDYGDTLLHAVISHQ